MVSIWAGKYQRLSKLRSMPAVAEILLLLSFPSVEISSLDQRSVRSSFHAPNTSGTPKVALSCPLHDGLDMGRQIPAAEQTAFHAGGRRNLAVAVFPVGRNLIPGSKIRAVKLPCAEHLGHTESRVELPPARWSRYGPAN